MRGPLASCHNSRKTLTLLQSSSGKVTGKSAVIIPASVAGKILARVMLRRLLTHVVDIVKVWCEKTVS